jgi:hypothetical protein
VKGGDKLKRLNEVGQPGVPVCPEDCGSDYVCPIDICLIIDTDPCSILDFCGVYDGPASSV